MTFIQIGNVTVQSLWIAIVLAFFVFVVGEKYIQKKSTTWFQDAFFNYIIIWKFSYILFQFPHFIDYPMSALYFSGGLKGHILGIVLAFVFLVYKTKKRNQLIPWKDWLFSFQKYFLLFQAIYALILKQFIAGGILIALYGVILFKSKEKQENLNHWIFITMFINSIMLAVYQQIFSTTGWTLIGITVMLLLPMLKEKQFIKTVVSWMLIIVLSTITTFTFEGANADKAVLSKEVVDIELENLSGETVHLSDYEGKKIILNFWATWCPPCKAEIPHLQKFYEQHDDVEIIGVNLTSRDQGREKLEDFIDEYQLTFPILLDEDGTYGDIYDAVTIPTSYFINSKGEIVEKVVGPMDVEMMETLIKNME